MFSRFFPLAVLLAACMLWLGLALAQTGDESQKTSGMGAAIPTLRQAIEKRFGRPDRIVGDGNSLLHYYLDNGGILTLVLANEKVVGTEHTKKTDLKTVVGKKVSLVGVYNGRAKAEDQIEMADGQWFWLQNRNRVSDDGKLFSVTGVLKYFPGTHGPDYIQGIPAHYYMESDSADLKVLYPLTFLNR